MSTLAASLKARDIEETLDVYFYRPLGFAAAQLARWLGLSPNAVTLGSALAGIVAANMLYWRDLRLNLVGVGLLVLSETLDAADGQLARLTGHSSRIGRILDGLASNAVYAAIYLHLVARLAEGRLAWYPVFLSLALVAGASHSFQCAAADFFRNAYLYFVLGAERSELDVSSQLERVRGAEPSQGVAERWLWRLYHNYTREQALMAPGTLRLYARAQSAGLPPAFRAAYRELYGPLIKYHNVLTANTRMVALCAAVLSGFPLLYLLFEVLVLNALLLVVLARQERNAHRLGRLLDEQHSGETPGRS